MPTGILRLSGIEFSAILGVLPEERIAPRLVRLDLECSGEWSAGAAQLLDYRDAVDAVAALAGREYGLLEDLVSDVLSVLEGLRPGLAWKVTATKAFPSLRLRTDSATFTGCTG